MVTAFLFLACFTFNAVIWLLIHLISPLRIARISPERFPNWLRILFYVVIIVPIIILPTCILLRGLIHTPSDMDDLPDIQNIISIMFTINIFLSYISAELSYFFTTRNKIFYALFFLNLVIPSLIFFGVIIGE